MDEPKDPIAAVTHPDPYPYYATLREAAPIRRNEELGLWIATGASAVRAVLTSETCRVRPAAEPVPRALVGSPAGEVFRHLVRMTDGPGHYPLKRAVTMALSSLDPGPAAAEARRAADRLVAQMAPAAHPERLAELAFRLSALVMASLVGIAPPALDVTADDLGDLVRSLAPGATADQLRRGADAARRLRERVRSLLTGPGTAGLATGLAASLASGMRPDDEVHVDLVADNAIGYMSQAYEATAGLIGNTLVALGRHAEARATLAARPAALEALIREVVRFDAPVQNTRRFVGADGVVAGETMLEGEAILVVLAAANRDPAANARPDRFDPARGERQAFTFGVGPHACPGEALAVAIAEAGVASLLAAGVDPAALVDGVTYRPSVNTRVPLFAGA
jgi:cytochrome P450